MTNEGVGAKVRSLLDKVVDATVTSVVKGKGKSSSMDVVKTSIAVVAMATNGLVAGIRRVDVSIKNRSESELEGGSIGEVADGDIEVGVVDGRGICVIVF